MRYALSEVSRALSEDREGGYAAFERVDREGSGCVDHQGVMDIVKRVCPNLRTREVRDAHTRAHTDRHTHTVHSRAPVMVAMCKDGLVLNVSLLCVLRCTLS